MKMRNIILVIVVFFHISIFGQIRVSEIEKPEEGKKIEIIDRVPEYDSIQNFITYQAYCENLNEINNEKYRGESTDKWTKPCDINQFYKRYVGLQIYYPDYTNDYRNHEIKFFNYSNYDSISWAQTGNKTYKILDINAGIVNSPQFSVLKKKYPSIDFKERFNYGIIFILKDIASSDTICVFDNLMDAKKFILVPFYNNLKTKFINKEFKVKNYRSNVIIELCKNKGAIIEESQTLKCKDILIVHNSSIYDFNQYSPCSYESRIYCNQDITILFVLTENDKTYYFDDTYQDYKGIETSFTYYFMLKNAFERQVKNKQVEEQKQDKAKLDNLIRKYGKVNGTMIYNYKIVIGMSKKMCEEVWGTPSNCIKTTSSNGVSEVCRYSKGLLKYTNGILTKIFE